LVTVFEGKGGTINDILDQTAQLTSTLADSDQAIGEVIDNLNTVLRTTVTHQREFDQTVDHLQQLISGLNERADPIADGLAHISDAAGSVSDLLADNRPVLRDTVTHLQNIQGPLIDKQDQLDDLLTKLPNALRIIGRIGGIYGDFFNFYLCDVTLKINGLQPGGPVRTVKVLQQPTGRCTPK
jgi:phospholipid/cholesterol/gamma-HCH transport system substrate-binding protein